MKNLKTFTIVTFALMLIFLITTITFSTLWAISYRSDEVNNRTSFDYIKPDKIEISNLVDLDKSIFEFEYKDIYNFQETGMKLVQTSYSNLSGISTTFIDSTKLSEIYNIKNTSYFTPYYLNNELVGMISGMNDANDNGVLVSWNQDERHIIDSSISNYDHEMFKYKDKYYVLNGTKIWIIDDLGGKENYFQYSPRDGLGLPFVEDEDGNRVASTRGHHFNSFDIYGENILFSSRDYGVIFSLKILNEDGNLIDKEYWELNWVLSGNSITPWFIESNYEQDGNPETWENPIINNGGTDPMDYYNFDENPNYVPKIFTDWENKLLKINVGGVDYDFTNIDQAKAFNELDNDHKFWGQHTARVINSYLDSVSDKIDGYDSNKLYISIHDNHFPSDVVNKYDDSGIYGTNWGGDPYSFHAYTNKTKEVFGDNPYSLEEDKKSFTKIYEIDASTMTAKEVLNRDNTISSEIDHFSDYRSSSTFFSINGDSYLVTESSMNSSFALVAFDGIDFVNQTLINERTIMDVQWIGAAAGYIHYRTYPIFDSIENVVYGWNALNNNPYMG